MPAEFAPRTDREFAMVNFIRKEIVRQIWSMTVTEPGNSLLSTGSSSTIASIKRTNDQEGNARARGRTESHLNASVRAG